ncbi:hypothetical protein NL676_036725 [Syzygium grande]|nr:hypothetical protein NL676_036725 [Syzygium grande]
MLSTLRVLCPSTSSLFLRAGAAIHIAQENVAMSFPEHTGEEARITSKGQTWSAKRIIESTTSPMIERTTKTKGPTSRMAQRRRRRRKPEAREMPLMALNYVSRLCRSVKDSIEFYRKVLGFVLIKRPQAFDFDGAWLFNYGISIHLVQSHDKDRLPRTLTLWTPWTTTSPFRASIDQLFFTDPDQFMIEICNCENLKLVPAGSLGKIKLPFDRHNPLVELNKEEES